MARASTERQEYWRPANPNVAWLVAPPAAETVCWNCGADYSTAARFCHACGARREHSSEAAQQPDSQVGKGDESLSIRRRSLPLTSLVCLVLGVCCVIGAAALGIIYRTDTLVDWQAVQAWRVEWLLASLAAFLAGILLKTMR